MSKIPRTPKIPPAKVPADPRYFEPRDLEAELLRTFQICHECRMCVGYCGSFPELFRRIDRDIDSGKSEGAEHLDAADIHAVAEECWQCKLCYIKCPYTEDDGATELLDFPRVMLREKAQRARRDGVSLVDTILGEPQIVGALGAGPAAKPTNLIHASSLVRKVQEVVAGVSSKFPIPPMASETFSTWRNRRDDAPAAREGDVVLFHTCYGEYNAPNVAIAAVRVLERNGYRVLAPGVLPAEADAGEKVGPGATCCGMPNLDGGDLGRFADKVRQNVELLYPQVKAGLSIVVPNPTCAMTMKKTWAEHVDTPETRAVAAATFDLMEFFVQLGRQKKLDLDFEHGLGTVAYHAACHLRAQKVAIPGARVLGKAKDTDVRVVEECSAVDGTWGMKAEHYETGRKYAQKLVRGVKDVEPDLVVTDCMLSSLRLQHETGLRVLHSAEAMAEAYGLPLEPPSPGIVPGGSPAATKKDRG
jgi:glycerol-3-phosphate dehydrogenase subunit C